MIGKKGALTASNVVTSIILAVILGVVAVNLWPTLADALGDLANTTTLPLASLFGATGIVGILFAVGIFYGFYKLFWHK